MMKRFATEKQYQKRLIAQFKGSEDPEILIVVDKLLPASTLPATPFRESHARSRNTLSCK